MAEVRVADVKAHAEDAVGVPIEFVYAKDVPLYAVYRTPERVLIHFADAPDKREAQRRDLIRFNPIRGEINGLINGWRTSKYAGVQSRARRFDRRVADALTVALEGDLDGASLLLDRVKQDIIAERTSWARFLYLMIASGAVLVILLLSAFATSNWFVHSIFDYGGPGAAALAVWLAFGAGAIGAFFSIATAIRSRTILTDLQTRDNAADAVLRVVVGAIGGGLLLLIILSGAVGLKIGPNFELSAVTVLGSAYSAELIMLLGFAAGFSERMVTDLLAKVTPAELAVQARVSNLTGGHGGTSGAGTQAQSPPPPPPPAASSSAAAADVEDHPDADVDGCVSDLEPAEGEATSDAELPPSTGGVEHAPDPAPAAPASATPGAEIAVTETPAGSAAPST